MGTGRFLMGPGVYPTHLLVLKPVERESDSCVLIGFVIREPKKKKQKIHGKKQKIIDSVQVCDAGKILNEFLLFESRSTGSRGFQDPECDWLLSD